MCRSHQLAAPPGARGLHPPGSGRAEAVGYCLSLAQLQSQSGRTCAILPWPPQRGPALPRSPQPGLGLFSAPALAFEFQPCYVQEQRLFGGLQLPRGGQAGCPGPLRLRHVAHVSPDEVFHQPQVHSLCSRHIPAKGDPPKSSLHKMLGLAMAWGNQRVMRDEKPTSSGCFLGDKLGWMWPPRRGSSMTTPKCKAMGAGAALAPGQGLGTGAGLCPPGLGAVFWGKGCKSSCGPTSFCLPPRVPPSGLGRGPPPSPKHLNRWGLLTPL